MTDTPTLETMLSAAEPAIRQVVGRRLGGQPDAAEDAAQQVRLHLSERFSRMLAGAAPAIDSVPDYAARAAYNVVHDQFRAADTARHRLKNRVRYVLSQHDGFAVWSGPADLLCGRAAWRETERPLASEALARLREGDGQLPADAYSADAWDAMDGEAWRRWLDAVFTHLGGPVELDPLVSATAALLGVELRARSAAGQDPDEDRDGEAPDAVTDRRPAPETDPATRLHLKEQLQILWTCLQALPRPWRLAVMLNPPGPRKSERGDLAVLVSQGIAAKSEIRAVLELTPADYVHLGATDDGGGADGPAAFEALWQRLPVADAEIGRALGRSHMQVIGLRRLGVRRLARCRSETLVISPTR